MTVCDVEKAFERVLDIEGQFPSWLMSHETARRYAAIDPQRLRRVGELLSDSVIDRRCWTGYCTTATC